MVCSNNSILCHFWVNTTFTVHMTASNLEKSFSFKDSWNYKQHAFFHSCVNIQQLIHGIFPESEMVQTAKVTFKVTDISVSRWPHMFSIRFKISIATIPLSCTTSTLPIFETLSVILQNLKRSSGQNTSTLETIHHACTGTSQYQSAYHILSG